MAEKIDERWPSISEAEVDNIRQSIMPTAGQPITAGLRWSEDDLKVLNQSANELAVPEDQHEDTSKDPDKDSGRTLYKACLRVWHMLPTEIISPSVGLVFHGRAKTTRRPSKVLEMKWTHDFYEALLTVLVHSEWRNDLKLMISAIKFACVCSISRTERWIPEDHHDPFFGVFLACQARYRDCSRLEIFKAVESQLKDQHQWPSRLFEIFKSIDQQSSLRDLERQEVDGASQHLLWVRTADLTTVAKGLDNTVLPDNEFPLYPAELQRDFFVRSLPIGRSHNRDWPRSEEEYAQIRKIGLKYLRANAMAYQMAWDKKNVVFESLPSYPRSPAVEDEHGDYAHDDDDDDDDDDDTSEDDVVFLETRPRRHAALATQSESNSQFSSSSSTRKRALSEHGQQGSNTKRQCSHQDARGVEELLKKKVTSPEEAMPEPVSEDLENSSLRQNSNELGNEIDDQDARGDQDIAKEELSDPEDDILNRYPGDLGDMIQNGNAPELQDILKTDLDIPEDYLYQVTRNLALGRDPQDTSELPS
ncbi:hypothetical protein F5Y01DRAFT_327777 [Xylaria sp. FL0043]|nr:hypothetical protein F5Y01DRAFT_327777 [Xylaria sp. FL0043]